MKKAMMLLMAVGTLDTATAHTTTATELIVNGNFSTSHCHPEYCVSSGHEFVRGWVPEPQIEIGFGSYYNKYLGKERVLDLAPTSNSCIRQVIKGLTAGTYRLMFEYAARSDLKSEDCKFAVKLNGRVLKSITPLDDRIRTEVIDVQIGKESEGVLQFCSTGERNDNAGAILKSVSFARKTGTEVDPTPVVIPIKRPGENLITNPNFEKNPCAGHFCHYNIHQPNIVEGWIPDTELEIGYGSIYNKFLADQRVLELATGSNQCVRQVVRDLRPGLYDLSYEYTTRSEKPLTEGEFEVSWEGKVLGKLSPVSDRLEKDTVNLEVKQGTDGILKFCSLGPNNHEGAILRSVFMTRKKIADQPPGVKSIKIFLDSHSGKCLQREFTLQGGLIDINFDFKILSNAAVRETLTYVTLDGTPIYQISPCSSGKRLSVQTEVKSGAHLLGFCSVGGKNDYPHQIEISNMELDEKPVCLPGWSQNLVKNGNFQQNKCSPHVHWCIYNRHNIEKSVPNWIPDPIIEVGRASFYNEAAWSKVSLSTVSELDSAGNACIKQRIPQVTDGKYRLKFDWAAKIGLPLDTSGVEVRISGQAIRSFDAKSYDINRETIQFELETGPSDPLLEFCATGKSDHYGASVDNIELVKLNQC